MRPLRFLCLPRMVYGVRASLVSVTPVSKKFIHEERKCVESSTYSSDTAPHASEVSNPLVFMDVAVEGETVGRIQIELFRDVLPRATEHFRSLCTGERGGGPRRSNSRIFNPHSMLDDSAFTYQGTPFHRIVPNFIMQGGDILTRDGRSNISAWGYNFPVLDTPPSHLGDSGLAKIQRHLPRTVALAHTNGDPQRCGSQFFFNLAHNTHLEDGKFMVVGQVVSGWEDVILPVSRCCGSRSGIPVSRAWVLDCGQSGGYLEEETSASLSGEREHGGSTHGHPGHTHSTALIRERNAAE